MAATAELPPSATAAPAAAPNKMPRNWQVAKIPSAVPAAAPVPTGDGSRQQRLQ